MELFGFNIDLLPNAMIEYRADLTGLVNHLMRFHSFNCLLHLYLNIECSGSKASMKHEAEASCMGVVG